MVDGGALNDILSVRNFVGIMALANVLIGWRIWVLLPGLMERWNERRRDRAAIEAAQYERMDARLQHVEHRHDECERSLAEEREQRHQDVTALRDELAQARGKIRELEGYMIGQGQARQEAANIVAVERLHDRENDKEGGK